VNVNIPMSLVRWDQDGRTGFAPSGHDIDYGEVMDAIKSGATGKIVDIEDQTEGEHVEIWSE